MKKVIHRADTRGHSQYDWLDSYHTFSFDEYFDSNRINFGALRVLNDDKVAPGEGFQTHPHKNMEIVSIPLKGHLQHGDSKKNSRIITVGEIQTMSAGTGIFHSEVNASPVEPVEFLQIWIIRISTSVNWNVPTSWQSSYHLTAVLPHLFCKTPGSQ